MDGDVETVLADELRASKREAVPVVWGDGVGVFAELISRIRHRHRLRGGAPRVPQKVGILVEQTSPKKLYSPSLAGVAELADAPDSKSGAGNSVGVQVPPPAPLKNRPPRNCTDRVIAGRFRCVGHAIATGK